MNTRLTIEVIFNECEFQSEDLQRIIDATVSELHRLGENYTDQSGPYVLSGIAKTEQVVGA